MKKEDRTKERPEVNNEPPENGGKAAEQGSPECDTAKGECDCVDNAQKCDAVSDGVSGREAGADEDEIAGLRNQVNEWKDSYLRLLADYDNYRKRTAREKETCYTSAKAETIKHLLPVYDNIERAVNNPTSDEAYKKGIEMIFQQLKDIFGALGVTEIEAEGAKFDPEKHNAVMHIEDDTFEENSVAEVFQRGFEIDGIVIRHAVVKVAN